MKLHLSATLFAAFLLTACGTVDTKGLTEKATNTEGSSAGSSARALTDEAATATAEEATETAEANDAAPDAPVVEEGGQLPAFLAVVKQARDYTRKLLGLDDSALKTFLAKVEAIRALATSPDDFEAKIAAAKAEFEAAMKAQEEKVAAAREAHKGELDAIFGATVKVFESCGVDVKLGRHEPRPPKGRKGKGPKGPGPRGPGHGPMDGGDGEGRRIMIGSGEFDGGMPELHGKAKGKRPPQGEGYDLQSDLSESAECKTATDALSALVIKG